MPLDGEPGPHAFPSRLPASDLAFRLPGSQKGRQILKNLTHLLQYLDLKPESNETAAPAPSKWPSSGNVAFGDVTLVYRKGLPPALNNLSFCIGGGEKVTSHCLAGRFAVLLK
jgi:ABC-type multidrug transport system fused ATPase/permease subunit